MPTIRKKPPDIIDSKNRSKILLSSHISNNSLKPNSKFLPGIQMMEVSEETMASRNNEISNFSEIPTKPIDTEMMTTFNLPSEEPTEVLFPPLNF